jgi:hypothetical protein
MIATVRVFFNALVMAARTGVGAIARESKARRPKNKFLPNFIKRFMKYSQNTHSNIPQTVMTVVRRSASGSTISSTALLPSKQGSICLSEGLELDSHTTRLYVGLGRDCAEKEYAGASCSTGPDSSRSGVQVMIAEKTARDQIDRIEQ